MSSKLNLLSLESRTVSGAAATEPELAFNICEVVSVDGCDELPYVFEISETQTLSFSLTASHEVDLVLCDESGYDDWVDGGFQSTHPQNALLALHHSSQHSLEFRPEQDTTLIAIIINLEDGPVQSVVAANVLSSAAKPDCCNCGDQDFEG